MDEINLGEFDFDVVSYARVPDFEDDLDEIHLGTSGLFLLPTYLLKIASEGTDVHVVYPRTRMLVIRALVVTYVLLNS